MRHSFTKTFVSLCLLNLFLFLQLAAFSHDLHASLHDCDEAEHECAITLLAKGQVDISTPPATPVRQESQFHIQLDAIVSKLPAHNDYSPPGRGPPPCYT